MVWPYHQIIGAQMPTLLAVDDDRSVLHMIDRAFKDSQIAVITAPNVTDALDRARQGIDVVLLDVMLPEISGLEAASKFRALDPQLPVIFITARSASDTAIEAMKLGAYDYLLKPLDLVKLRELVRRALEIRHMMKSPVALPREEMPTEGDQLVGRCPQMQEVYKSIGRVAAQDVAVLIHGESGTGKELIARAIYQHSHRANKPFLAVNCAAIPDSLLESELFGHERGSFTGAEHRRIGKFEQCTGGTIFMDEVGDMSPLVQSKVLRLIQEQRFERVGGSETIQTDVRIITATNRDLKRRAAEGKFREDLYYRLNGFSINVPPLRDRGNDVLLLLLHSLRRFNRDLGKDVHGFSPEALDLLLHYYWPGNVRELEAVVRQSLLQSTGSVILPEFLPDSVKAEPEVVTSFDADEGSSYDLDGFVESRLQGDATDNLYNEVLAMMERRLFINVLRHTDGNQSRAAKLLGITRGTLRNKIRLLHISMETTVSTPEEQLEASKREPVGDI
jgi:two-component system nitrogen regulation response regulator GlnG